MTSAPGVELLPIWQDPLTVALPATHPLAAQPVIQLAQLRGIPMRLAPRPDNPAFHDLILGACADAGFEPLAGPPFTIPQDALAEIGTGPPTWTVFYTAAADLMPARRVAFRPLDGLTTQTCLAVLPGPPTPALRRLLDACASANPANPARTVTDAHEPLMHGRGSSRSRSGAAHEPAQGTVNEMTPPVLCNGDAAGRPGTGRTQIIHSGAARTATPTWRNSRR